MNGGFGCEIFFCVFCFKFGEIFGDCGFIMNVNGIIYWIVNMSMSGIVVYDFDRYYIKEYVDKEMVVFV